METVPHITRIYNKIQLVLKQLAVLQKENEQLEKELLRTRQQKDIYESQLKNLQDQNYILKSATQNMSETDKAVFEQSLNKYVRDIDKCIGLLSE